MNIDRADETPALRLARYLKEYVGLRTTSVRDVTKYDTVLWLGDMPQDSDCRSPAWTEEYEAADVWLEVKKQNFEKVPAPPEVTRPWVDETALKRATKEFPPLLPSIFLPDEDAEVEAGETPPLVEHSLKNHPEIEETYARYRSSWEAWSIEHRRREAVQRVYAELFRLHTQVRKQGEIVEVVLGLGLVDWRAELNEKVVPIRRHGVVARVEIEFNAAKGLIRVGAPGDGARLQIEDDMLEAELRPDRSQYAVMEMQLDEIGDSIWDKSRMHTALRTWAGALSAHSRWSEGLGALVSSGNGPVVSFAPALILRKRTQTGMVRIYDELIGQLSQDSIAVPDGWAGLIDDVGDSAVATSTLTEEPGSKSQSKDQSEVYFPLPANREQRRIVEAIDKQRGVLVQGPPGTGKSHTIANLVCHLLATGKRVLITAETARALQVLKGKLPEDVRALCVSLLGQGGDAFAELNRAVQGITTRQAAYSPGAYDDRIAEIDRELDQDRRRLAETDTEIRSLRQEETCPHAVGNGAYHGTASAIAERVARERERFGWLRLSFDAEAESTLSNEKLLAWVDACRRYTPDESADARLQIPTTANLPTPAEFSAVVRAETEASVAVREIDDLRVHTSYASIRALAPHVREQMKGDLQRVEEQRLTLGRAGERLSETAVKDLIAGRCAQWAALLELTADRLAIAETLLDRLAERVVTIPDGADPRRVRADSAIALAYLTGGGTWRRFGVLTPKELKGRDYLRTEVLVDGLGAADGEALQSVCDHLDIEFALADVQSAWNAVGAPPLIGDRRLRAVVLKEQAAALERCVAYANGCQRLAQQMVAATPPIPEPDWLGGAAQRWITLIDAASIEDRLEQAGQVVESTSRALIGFRDLHDAHPLVRELLAAVGARDIGAYSLAYARLCAIEQTQSDQRDRSRVEAVLNEVAPGLVDVVSRTLDDEAWAVRFSAWQDAWRWAVADAWLEKRSDFEYQRQLWVRRREIEKQISGLLAEAAALRAWIHFFARLSPRESAALKSWREAVRAMGKGTGHSAKMARLRREARQYMDACRDAIPVWIMPRYLVAEMINPAPGRYDLVIIDEASQLGIESLFLFYIAKKMVVVGDDQQISPYGVGVADAAIAGLQQHYLSGIPHQHALSAQSSLYGNAKIRFSQNIVLREHFRCMPEIIQFCNDLCYASNGTPLDPLRAYSGNRLQPLVLRHVADGYRVGGAQNATNPPEADAIVAQVVACIEDPRYADATMGVISLQGEAQAKLIERKLMDALDPGVIEQRRLICGDAYAFQGDERTVIFLSMVAAPGETRIGALSTEAARQRFNVAVSRAQDQLWLYHTAELDVLSDACMRHRLLSYMLNPVRQTTAETEQRFDSKFERDVFRCITGQGFHVRTQVCVGDPTNHRYRIDLVVEGMRGRLAVECDGDEWHGPDRYEHDMARQRDLERAGWQFARVRGGDFYRDPGKAMAPVFRELDRLGIQPGGIDQAFSEPPAPVRLEVLDSKRASSMEPDAGEPPLAAAEPEVAIPQIVDAGSPEAIHIEPPSPSWEERIEDAQEEPLPPCVKRNPQSELFSAPLRATDQTGDRARYATFEGEAGPDPRHATPAEVAEGLCRIIDTEGPMLAKRAYDIYLRSCGIRRMEGELRRYMNKALQHAIQKGKVAKEDESGKGGLFYSIVRLEGAPSVLVRERGPRDFEEIPPSEIQLAARKLAEEGGLDSGSDAHLRAILNFFDLKRLTGQAGTTLLEILGRKFPYVDRVFEEPEG